MKKTNFLFSFLAALFWSVFIPSTFNYIDSWIYLIGNKDMVGVHYPPFYFSFVQAVGVLNQLVFGDKDFVLNKSFLFILAFAQQYLFHLGFFLLYDTCRPVNKSKQAGFIFLALLSYFVFLLPLALMSQGLFSEGITSALLLIQVALLLRTSQGFFDIKLAYFYAVVAVLGCMTRTAHILSLVFWPGMAFCFLISEVRSPYRKKYFMNFLKVVMVSLAVFVTAKFLILETCKRNGLEYRSVIGRSLIYRVQRVWETLSPVRREEVTMKFCAMGEVECELFKAMVQTPNPWNGPMEEMKNIIIRKFGRELKSVEKVDVMNDHYLSKMSQQFLREVSESHWQMGKAFSEYMTLGVGYLNTQIIFDTMASYELYRNNPDMKSKVDSRLFYLESSQTYLKIFQVTSFMRTVLFSPVVLVPLILLGVGYGRHRGYLSKEAGKVILSLLLTGVMFFVILSYLSIPVARYTSMSLIFFFAAAMLVAGRWKEAGVVRS